nr:MAG TPA: hypothetical protein [Bacteriophage sp.]
MVLNGCDKYDMKIVNCLLSAPIFFKLKRY